MTVRAPVSQATEVQDGWIFFGLMALLVWAPLPLASNRYWAAGLLLLMAVVLLAGTVWAWRRSGPGAWQRLLLFRWPLALLAAFVALAWLQTAPLPAPWVAALSPNAALAQIPAQWMTLSLDVYQSRYMASLSFVYLGVFGIVLLTVRNSERLDRLAQVLVWSGVTQAALAAVLLSLKAEYRIFYVDISHHDAIGSFVNRNHELMAAAKEFDMISTRLINHYKKTTGLDETKIKELLLPPHDIWLSAKEAKQYGICDVIKELY